MMTSKLSILDARATRHRYAFLKNPAQYVAREKFAFPGGYDLALITDDGGILCANCTRANYKLIRKSYPRDGWHPAFSDCSANWDSEYSCDHCGRIINPQD